MAARRTARPAAVLGAALVALLVAAGVFWFYQRTQPVEGPAQFKAVAFSDLPGWQRSDERLALDAFARSCTQILRRASTEPMGGNGYGGTVADWVAPCTNLPAISTADAARDWFERNFAPFAL